MITVGRIAWISNQVAKPILSKNSSNLMLQLVAKEHGVDLFSFPSGNINFEKKTILGLFIENGKQVYKEVPIPPIVDNSTMNYGSAFQLELAKHTRLVNYRTKVGKQRVYDMLEADGTYKDMLIPTKPCGSFEDLTELTNTWGGKVIIKTINGSGGKSVHLITRTADGYDMHKGKTVSHIPENSAKDTFDALLSEATYVAQPFFRSLTGFGEPVDLRVRCRRGRNGNFIVDIVPRIGSAKGIVSNLSSGGYTIPSNIFFMREFDETHEEEHAKVLDFGATFARFFTSKFQRRPFDISNVGIDLGYEKNEDGTVTYRIFEVNTGIGHKQLPLSDVINQLEYYKFLHERFVLYHTNP